MIKNCGEMFKKPKKNFRSRRLGDDCDDHDDDDDVMIIEPDPIPVPIPTKKPKKKKKDKNREREGSPKMTKSQSTLSFDDEGEVDSEEFQIKKSSHSRRIAKMLKREHKKEKEEQQAAQKGTADSLAPAAGAYSADNLKQMRIEQECHNGVSMVDMDIGSDVELALEKRPEFPNEDPEPDEPETKDPLEGPVFRNMIASGHIPDASMIHLARKKRQLARERGDDYIPIEETEKPGKTGSRLIREEDHDRSDDEEDRLVFNVDKHEEDLRRMQNTILEHEQGSNSESSDHEAEWEKQQIRKGVQACSTNPTDLGEVTKQYQQYYFGATPPGMPQITNGNNTNIIATRATPPQNLPPITIDVIRKRLTDRLDELVSVHRAHVLERDDITSRMESCTLDQDQPGSSSVLENRYRFFHEMRGYVGDLVECLAQKMTSINYLDRCMMIQWQQRAEKIIQRRQQDIKDQAHQYMPKKASAAVEEVNAVVEEARQRRVAEREARRSRRRRGREFKGSSTDHCDGLSTDDEENKSETIKLNKERDHITVQVRTMFDDVVDDFHKLDLIKGRFEDWKYTQGDSYDEAYIGLCLPKLFTPFIKLNLILWNPLETDCVRFEETRWFEALMFYGYKEGFNQPDEDVDIKLVPTIVEKIVLPKLTAFVETVWDPMSTKQTERLTRLVTSLIQDYPTITSDNKYTQSLIQSIGERIKKSLEDDVFMPLYSKQVLENRLSGSSQFFHRQFWSSVKLFGNLCMCQGILSDPTLQQLSLACLLSRYLVLSLSMSPINADSIYKCQKIVSLIPKAWFIPLDGLNTIPLLESFCRYLVGAATSLEKSAPNDQDCKQLAREGVKQIRKMLINLHAMDQAANLADQSTT